MIFALLTMFMIVTSKDLSEMTKITWALFTFFIMAFGALLQTPLAKYVTERREQEQFA